jgi:hypothetical protein
MKKIVLSLFLMIGFSALNLHAQSEKSHFDNKPYVEGEMLVQLEDKASLKSILSKLPAEFGIEILEEVSKPMRVWLVKFNHQAISHADMQRTLYRQVGISTVDYNYYVQFRETVPNDTEFAQQWHHKNTGQTGGTADADIDSDLAWDITTGGNTATGDDIVVCVIESANLTHTDLTANAWLNQGEIASNGIDDDGNGYIDDYRGWNPAGNNDVIGTGAHGTNCAGMIGATGNNGLGVVGANWDVKIMSVTVGNLTQSNVIASYTYPLVQRQRWNNSNGTEGAFVVATSSSWGIDNASAASYPLWCAFYDTLGKYGIISIGATTNSNSNVDTNGDMPTTCTSRFMVGVGRTDHNDNTAGGFGVTHVDFGAPGINVRTTSNTNSYTTTTGTSFSCPLTAGVVGLAYAIPCASFMDIVKSNPEAGADLVLDAMINGVDVKSQLATKFRTGGRLNSKNTLDLLMDASCSGTFCSAPGALSTSNISEESATASWTPYSEAVSTTLFFKQEDETVWTELTPTSSSFTFENLEPCTSYQFYLVSNCADDATSNPSSTVTFTTSGCGNCIELPYCTAAATDGADEWIETFVIGTFTENSGNDNGYGNFTGAASIELQAGTSYPISITPGFGGQAYNEYSRVWLDANQDGTFGTDELIFDQGAAAQTVATGTVSIPTTALPGSTRLRVQLAYQGTGQTTLPPVCGTFTYGEVEDYCVEILENEICGFVVTSTVTQPTCEQVQNGSISVSVTGGASGYTYTWSNDEATSNITNLSEGTFELVLADQAGCDTTLSFELAFTTELDVTIETTNPLCAAANDGTLTALATGGNGITYQWQNGPSTAAYVGVGAGVYTVTATDDQGCLISESATLTDPAAHQASFTMTSDDLIVTLNNTSTAGTVAWTFGDGETSTVSSPTHTYTAYGTYTICVEVTTACGVFEDCQDVELLNTASLEDLVLVSSSVYPNPAQENINILVNSSAAKMIKLIDVSGKELASLPIDGELTTFSVSQFSNGMYFYHLLDATGKVVFTNRFVIEK